MQLLKYGEGASKGVKGRLLNIDNFLDTSNIEGRFDFSEWVRAYGKYLDEQLEVYARISFYPVRALSSALSFGVQSSTVNSSWRFKPVSASTGCPEKGRCEP